MKKIISTVLVAGMLLSVTACNDASSNRETITTGETMDTVNPDVSMPEQSIPSDAMIPETETETESETSEEVKYNNTYTINGCSFTISEPVEKYVYTLPGSENEFIHMDEFMAAYGFEPQYIRPYRYLNDDAAYKDYLRCFYKNADGIEIIFSPEINAGDYSLWKDGLDVCQEITFDYPEDFSGETALGPYEGIALVEDENGDLVPETKYKYKLLQRFHLQNDSNLKNSKAYGVNAELSEDGEVRVKYCFTVETLVVLGVIMDKINETGSTVGAVEPLCRICEGRSYTHDNDGFNELFLLIQ